MESPFYVAKNNNQKGNKIQTNEELTIAHAEGNRELLEGNAQVLTKHYQLIWGKLNVKVAFFGSDYLKDVHATVETNFKFIENDFRHRWHAIPVIRDTEFKFSTGVDAFADGVQLRDKSSDEWFFNKKKTPVNLFVAYVAQFSRYALPELSAKYLD
jgi:hypothetical protein